MVTCPKRVHARLVRMAELRAAGLGWTAVAREIGCPAETCRALTRACPRAWRRLVHEAEQTVLWEIRAEARLALRNQLRSDDPAVVTAAAKVLFAECRREWAEMRRPTARPVEERRDLAPPVPKPAPEAPSRREACGPEPAPIATLVADPNIASTPAPVPPSRPRRHSSRRIRIERRRVRHTGRLRQMIPTKPNSLRRSTAMKRRLKHNYLRKLLAMQARGELTVGVSDVEVAHDNWCRIYKGGYCNCDPDIRVRQLFPRPIPAPSRN